MAEAPKIIWVWALFISRFRGDCKGLFTLPWLLSIPPYEKVTQLQQSTFSDRKQMLAVLKSKQKWLYYTFHALESIFD